MLRSTTILRFGDRIYGGTVYISVKDPIYINSVPEPFYLEDSDIAGIDLFEFTFELKFKGEQMDIHDLDALSLTPTRITHASSVSREQDEPSLGL